MPSFASVESGWLRMRRAVDITHGEGLPGLLVIRPGPWRGAPAVRERGRSSLGLRLAGEDVHHVLEQLDGLVTRALEGVAAHDGAEAAALVDLLDLLEQ